VNRDQVPLICNKHLQSGNVTSGSNRNGGGQFHTECCQEELCNGGPFPILQDRTSGESSALPVICFQVLKRHKGTTIAKSSV
jgi:hypothetical protein